jgi:hypothetical protein
MTHSEKTPDFYICFSIIILKFKTGKQPIRKTKYIKVGVSLNAS